MVGVLLVAAAVAVFVAWSSGGSDAVAPITPAPAAATPLWSVRRVPEPIVEAVGAQHLQAALDREAPGDGTCFVVTAGDHTIAAHDGDTPLIPASTQKLMTAAAALSILGPDSSYQTRVVAPAAPDNGTVDRLWLVGSGDPGLTTADYRAFLDSEGVTHGSATTSLEALADAVVAKGVRRVPGGVVGDESHYDDVREVAGWKGSYVTDGEISPLSALTVNGGYASWSPTRRVPVDDAAHNAAVQFAALLRSRGVDVGSSDTGTAPPNAAEIAQVTSPALRAIVSSMLVTSDNLAAELLTKEIGVRVAKSGSTAAGITASTAKLKELGVAIPDDALKDGSGLDRGNRLTCNELIAALNLASTPGLTTLYDGLPIAGQNGTLYDQFLGTPFVGKIRAKTGTLDFVTGLTGVVDLGRQLHFAFLANGDFTEAEGDAFRVRIGDIIGRFPDAPAVDALVPAPQ